MTTAYSAHFFGKLYDRMAEDLHLTAPAAVPREPKLIADRATGTTEATRTHASAGLLEQRT